MPADSLDPTARANAHALIVTKRDAIVAERDLVMKERAALLVRLRRLDRELSDCRAAARLFELDIEFPADEREEADRAFFVRRQELESTSAEAVVMRRNQIVHGSHHVARSVAAPPPSSRPVHLSGGYSGELPASAVAATTPPSSQLQSFPPPPSPTPVRPPIKDVVLSLLERAGDAGEKAAPMRDFIERTYGEPIHAKTVGMTLYRLLKENLVRRDGHTWFFGPASKAGTKDPGGETPGPINAFE